MVSRFPPYRRESRHGHGQTRGFMANKKGKGKGPGSNVIALNKKARFEYHIDEVFEAGLVLAGWEVKSLRAGKAQLTDTYILVKDGEDRKSTRLNSSHVRISYAVFCLEKKS